MKTIARLFLSAATLFAAAGSVQAQSPSVVASIKPVHSLVAAIMQGVGEPALIVDGAASPHTYSMKPSKAALLQDANMVFWVGPGLEAFLGKPLQSLGASAVVVELEDAPGLEKLKFREGGAFEAHDHGDHEAQEAHHEEGEHAHEQEDGHDHDHGGFDMHLWLDPANAKAMAAEIERKLSAADAANAATYKANLATLDAKLDALDAEIAETVAPIKEKPFIVFHDAYQYFEHRYGLRVAGSITVSPETMPGAERISEIHKKIGDLGATCVFAEPQFEPKLVNVVIEGTPARSGTLDPEAATLTEGPELYFDLMKGLAGSLKECLATEG
ncbi:zinc ABC transporter substrate-binding protein ZnuA [Sinorhizobium sp. BG8]|uniref:zinc ABC transporter substrate-binding protein ZnuA n=1 Tax=Sinorhizobium sp. BG8 TaxID=2613773 RepID=UPI00193D9636|nr:zinc ABC transporter substrate-binding protein ZnuA [Sinorhizobium sp. BG8]QRM55751.1 zinc ABC transporter substrate-binding protein ZnuA [Sinorhizobium sp. BG8]